jgi:predicted PurR-regulated permease PerM
MQMRQERIFFAVLFAIVTVLAVIIMWPFLTFIVLAGILTYTLFPIYHFFRKRLPRPGFASGLSILVALILMVLPAVFLVNQLARQVSGAYTNFQAENIQRVANYLSGLTGNRIDFLEMLNSGLDQIRVSMVGLAPDILGSIGELLLGLFIMFFVMYYGFREGEAFIARLRQLLPLEPSLKESLFYEVRTITQAVLYGQVMTAVIQGTLGAFGLLVFGVSNWLFWGAIMIITAFIPVLGTPIVWVPASVGLILEGNTARGIGLLIFGSTIVMNIDNFLRPRLMSGRTTVHPVLILIGVLGGLKIFGFVGMLVGPLILALLVAFIKFYEQAYLQPKVVGPAAD